MSEKLTLWLVVGLIVVAIIAIVVTFAVYIPWQTNTNRMNQDRMSDAYEHSPQNIQRLYELWQGTILHYENGDKFAIREADKLAAEIVDLYGDNSILIPTSDGHLWIDGSKI